MYTLGPNRIVYQSLDLQSGKSVYIILWNPKGEESNKFYLQDNGDGIYYLTVAFKYSGSYIGRVYENDSYAGSKIFIVNNYKGIIIPYIKEMYGW
jgi:hypothetical protein